MNEGIFIYGLPHCLGRSVPALQFHDHWSPNVRVAPGELRSLRCQHSLELYPSLGPCPLKSLNGIIKDSGFSEEGHDEVIYGGR